jgi:hypothetical protein
MKIFLKSDKEHEFAFSESALGYMTSIMDKNTQTFIEDNDR